MNFNALNLHPLILRAIEEDGYANPTPIQEKAIPILLNGQDILGCAQTGTGKTAAFALPIIHHILKHSNKGKMRKISALILAPTRELALQIKESFDRYARKNHVKAVAVYGGISKYNQIVKIKRGVDVLIATPGRLLDLHQMKVLDLSSVKHYVLDEADQMLDMGFILDVNKITSLIPEVRQTMLFSATIPASIESLARKLLNAPVRLEITPQHTPLETITQKVFFVSNTQKLDLLTHTLKQSDVTSALVFVKTKRYCDKVTKRLVDDGIKVNAIHGDKTQAQRQNALNAFKAKKIQVLVATDVAARGIDIDSLSHVINLDMPQTPETYLHRIGRTARAGALGSAYSFCIPEDRHLLKAIQKHIGFTVPVEAQHPFHISHEKIKMNGSHPQAFKPKKKFKDAAAKPYRSKKKTPHTYAKKDSNARYAHQH